MRAFLSVLSALLLLCAPALAEQPVVPLGSGQFTAARRFEPYYLVGPLATNPAIPVTDTCTCYLYWVPGMDDLDVVRLYVATTSATNTTRVAVYSEDGAINYLVATPVVTAAGSVDATNTITTPPRMPPGNYWLCYARNSTAATTAFAVASAISFTTETVIRFSQTCTGATMPASLTAPTRTFVDATQEPWFALLDK